MRRWVAIALMLSLAAASALAWTFTPAGWFAGRAARQYTAAAASAFPTNGLLGRWLFDVTNTPTHDAVSTNHGTVYGATWTSNDGVRSSPCYLFTGASNYIDMGKAPGVDPGTGDFSWSIWVRYRSNQVNIQGLFGRAQLTSGDMWIIEHSGYTNQYRGRLRNASTTALVDSWITVADTSVWRHVMCVADRTVTSNLLIYVNGVLSNSVSCAALAGTITNTLPIQVGCYASAYFVNAWLDDPCVWGRALTSQEVYNAWNATK